MVDVLRAFVALLVIIRSQNAMITFLSSNGIGGNLFL